MSRISLMLLVGLIAGGSILAGCSRQASPNSLTEDGSHSAETTDPSIQDQTDLGLGTIEESQENTLPTEPVTAQTENSELLELLTQIDTELGQGLPNESDLAGLE